AGQRHRPQPQLGLQVGLLRWGQRQPLLRDLPGERPVLGPGDRRAARLRQLAGGRRHPADQGRDRLPHLLRAGAVAVRAHHRDRQDSGTDLNRNWGYKWGCCGGASDNPSSETYRGSAPFSAPETAALRDFVNSRVVDGTQQIKAAIDFHTYSELVLWPFGHTT